MQYACEFEVRDNEIDVQGVVNNTNYFIYMMHARHKHLKSLGIDFEAMHHDGYNLFLVHADVSFKASLVSGDEFIVTSRLKSNGKIRLLFEQEVIRKRDGKIMVSAVNTGVCISIATGKPVVPEVFKQFFLAQEEK
jgi:acyl-CoA thioester hydrolase